MKTDPKTDPKSRSAKKPKVFALITGASSGIGDHEDDGRWRISVEDSLKHEKGEFEFGTELVVAQDRSIVALLGASTAAAIAIGVLETPLISIAGEKQTRSRAASQARSSGCLPMCLPIAAWFT